MTSRRLLKAAEAIREVVSMAVLTELKDPRVRNVTVIKVEVLPDMKQAKVYVSVMGDETEQKLTLRGLQSSAGFLQHKVASRIETRYTPKLEFVLDRGVKNALEIDRILRRVLPTEENPETPDHPAAETDEQEKEMEPPMDADERGCEEDDRK